MPVNTPLTSEEVGEQLRRADELIESEAWGEALWVLWPLDLNPAVRGRARGRVELALARIAMAQGLYVGAARKAHQAREYLSGEELRATIDLEREARAQRIAQHA